MTNPVGVSTEEVIERLKDAVNRAEALSKALQRKQERLNANKTTQAEPTSVCGLEHASEIVQRDTQRDTTLFKRWSNGWALVSEEVYDPNPTMTKMTFVRKVGN